MKKLLIAIAGLLMATPAAAQIDKGCYTAGSGAQVAVSTDLPGLKADVACFRDKVIPAVNVSIANREKRIAELEAQMQVINPADWIYDTGIKAGTGKPDVVGAWRVDLRPLDYGYNDAVLYPGIKNGSMHGHSNYGVRGINEKTTSEGLLAHWNGGFNALLGSAYWTPWLERLKDRKIIQYKTIHIYYKRYPINDPLCKKEALKGCIPLLKGIKMIAGYDMSRMGQAQPENQEFSHRCASDGKPSIHRKSLDQALADCGGSGRIISAIGFPDCSDGRTDSPNHRDHLASRSYGWWGYPKCPDTHPYLMPTVTQQVDFDVLPEDGPVAFSSDNMPGMVQPAGSTFHADYIFGLHPFLVEAMERCFNELLSCSGGDLGNKTALKLPANYNDPIQRVIDAPAR